MSASQVCPSSRRVHAMSFSPTRLGACLWGWPVMGRLTVIDLTEIHLPGTDLRAMPPQKNPPRRIHPRGSNQKDLTRRISPEGSNQMDLKGEADVSRPQ